MAKSQNGWQVQPNTANLWPNPYVGGILAGPVWVVLSWFVRQFNELVEPVQRAQSGCYNRRRIAGSTKWSNHASATAVDLNWNKHPAGRRGTFTAAQTAVLLELVEDAGGIIRWGRLYEDEMHFEIAPKVTRLQVERLAVKLLQRALTATGHNPGPVDGIRGPKTTAALKAFQAAHQLTPDGIDGPQTWAALTT